MLSFLSRGISRLTLEMTSCQNCGEAVGRAGRPRPAAQRVVSFVPLPTSVTPSPETTTYPFEASSRVRLPYARNDNGETRRISFQKKRFVRVLKASRRRRRVFTIFTQLYDIVVVFSSYNIKNMIKLPNGGNEKW